MLKFIPYVRYTWRHKIAFLRTEKQLTGKISWRGLVHDVDKFFMYLIYDKDKVSRIHRNYSRHHAKNIKTDADMQEAIIDWECARFTKPDKPLNAVQTLEKYYPELIDRANPILIRLGLKQRG